MTVLIFLFQFLSVVLDFQSEFLTYVKQSEPAPEAVRLPRNGNSRSTRVEQESTSSDVNNQGLVGKTSKMKNGAGGGKRRTSSPASSVGDDESTGKRSSRRLSLSPPGSERSSRRSSPHPQPAETSGKISEASSPTDGDKDKKSPPFEPNMASRPKRHIIPKNLVRMPFLL